MIFGGLQKNSMIDYPGKIACVFFVPGCNFACPYCHNPELARGLIDKNAAFDEDWAYRFLESRQGFIEGVVFLGGEPTLQKELPAVCRAIKRMGFPVKVDTNGSRPQMIRELIQEGLVDYIAMDIKTDPAAYAPVLQQNCDPEAIRQSIRLIMESGLAYEFKTTCVRPLVDETVIGKIARLIQNARRYVLQPFQPDRVLYPEFFEKHAEQFSKADLEKFKTLAAPWVKECLVR